MNTKPLQIVKLDPAYAKERAAVVRHAEDVQKAAAVLHYSRMRDEAQDQLGKSLRRNFDMRIDIERIMERLAEQGALLDKVSESRIEIASQFGELKKLARRQQQEVTLLQNKGLALMNENKRLKELLK